MDLWWNVALRALALGLVATYAFVVIRRWRRQERGRMVQRILCEPREEPLRHGERTTLAGRLCGGPAGILAAATGARADHAELLRGVSRQAGPLSLTLPDGEVVELAPPLLVLQGSTELWRGDARNADERQVRAAAHRLEPGLPRCAVLSALRFGDAVRAAGQLSLAARESGYRQPARRWVLDGGAGALILATQQTAVRPFPLRTLLKGALLTSVIAALLLLPLHLMFPAPPPEPTWELVAGPPEQRPALTPDEQLYIRLVYRDQRTRDPGPPGVRFTGQPDYSELPLSARP